MLWGTVRVFAQILAEVHRLVVGFLAATTVELPLGIMIEAQVLVLRHITRALVLDTIVIPAGVPQAHTLLLRRVVVQNGERGIVASPALTQLGDVHGIA